MAKTKAVRLTPEEEALIHRIRESNDGSPVEAIPQEVAQHEVDVKSQGHKELANALIEAIEKTKEPAKKNVFNRKKGAPYLPKDGSPRLKMKRAFFQHGLPISRVTNEVITLLNQLKPGVYCEGFVKVVLRKDRGIDIDYPVKTASQRLKLVNTFGIRNFKELLERLIAEQKDPQRFRRSEDMDLFD